MRIVIPHAARRPVSWLIFDVGQKKACERSEPLRRALDGIRCVSKSAKRRSKEPAVSDSLKGRNRCAACFREKKGVRDCRTPYSVLAAVRVRPPGKRPTRRQSQRPWLSRRVLRQESWNETSESE